MNSIKAIPGIMIEFEDSVKVKKFMEYAKRNKIKIHSITDNDKVHLIVVDIINEKETYAFTMNSI